MRHFEKLHAGNSMWRVGFGPTIVRPCWVVEFFVPGPPKVFQTYNWAEALNYLKHGRAY